MGRWLVVATIVALGLAKSAAADGLHVVDADFSVAAQPRADPPQSARLRGSAPKRAPLYFWSKIAGDNTALAEMATAEELPVRHVWTVRCFTASDPADADVTFASDEDIFVGQSRQLDPGKWSALIADLTREAAENARRHGAATFDWRTQSRKLALNDCVYTVKVQDRAGNELWCDNINALCEFKLTLSQ